MIVLSISSHVVAGRVGNMVAVPALAALGIEALPVPTVIYSNTPSPAGFAGAALPPAHFDSLLGRFESDGTLASLDAIHVGYVREIEHVARIALFLRLARRANPNLMLSLDPVLGDDGRLYVPEATAHEVRKELLPLVDIATPNLFELAWLTGRAIATQAEAIAAARVLGPHTVVVTSAPAASGKVATLHVAAEAAHAVTTPHLKFAPHGTGDLLAALFLGRVLRQEDPLRALEAAVASVYDLIARGTAGGELPLLGNEALLASPASRFSAVQIGGEPER